MRELIFQETCETPVESIPDRRERQPGLSSMRAAAADFQFRNPSRGVPSPQYHPQVVFRQSQRKTPAENFNRRF